VWHVRAIEDDGNDQDALAQRRGELSADHVVVSANGRGPAGIHNDEEHIALTKGVGDGGAVVGARAHRRLDVHVHVCPTKGGPQRSVQSARVAFTVLATVIDEDPQAARVRHRNPQGVPTL
jgi:hypothetical protein